MADTHTGTCFCGAVEIEATGAPLEMGYCHCGSCRHHSGAPLSAYLLWRAEDVRVTRGAEHLRGFKEHLRGFNKTGMSDRQHCSRCGGHVLTAHPGMGLADVRPPVLPTVPFAPAVHLNYAEAVLPVRDGLVKLKDFPAHAGGSGETVPE